MGQETVGGAELDVDALGEFIDECIEYFRFDDGVEVRKDRVRQFQMLFGLCAQVIRYAKGWKSLLSAGLPIEGRLLVRSAIEYAVTAQYVYLSVGGLDRLFKSAQSGQRELLARLHRYTGNGEYLDLAEAVDVPQAGNGLPTIDQLFNIVDPEDVIFRQSYALLSQATHVTTTSLTQHYVVTGDDPRFLQLNHHSEADTFRAQTTYTLALAVMAVTWIVAHVLGDQDTLVKLDQNSDDLRLPLRYDDSWPVNLRSFSDG
ncbi:DUF5677 domain-containing protein [Microbacterium sp. NPDC057659]|uniref:DUF5677 domain-containing protein n=1 Tax=Microbacterium sp. NPDC057659 TaxID=3346198 RepID=UPI00366FC25C